MYSLLDIFLPILRAYSKMDKFGLPKFKSNINFFFFFFFFFLLKKNEIFEVSWEIFV